MGPPRLATQGSTPVRSPRRDCRSSLSSARRSFVKGSASSGHASPGGRSTFPELRARADGDAGLLLASRFRSARCLSHKRSWLSRCDNRPQDCSGGIRPEGRLWPSTAVYARCRAKERAGHRNCSSQDDNLRRFRWLYATAGRRDASKPVPTSSAPASHPAAGTSPTTPDRAHAQPGRHAQSEIAPPCPRNHVQIRGQIGDTFTNRR